MQQSHTTQNKHSGVKSKYSYESLVRAYAEKSASSNGYRGTYNLSVRLQATNPSRDANYELTLEEIQWHSVNLDTDEDAVSFLTTPNVYVKSLVFYHCQGTIPADLRHVFPNLVKLRVCETESPTMPLVSESCTQMYFYSNKMSSVHQLPAKIQTLFIAYNPLCKIAACIPATTQDMAIVNTQLTELPDLPDDLEKLNVCNNRLECLPKRMPTNLHLFNCTHNRIRELPEEMANLQELACGRNQLTRFPPRFHETYRRLQMMDCSNNPLERLDYLPECIYSISLENTTLQTLPYLSPGLKTVQTNIPWVRFGFLESSNPYDCVKLTRSTLAMLQRFREMYAAVRLRTRFRVWLWSARETKLRRQLHPDALSAFLETKEEEEDLEHKLDEFFELCVRV